MRPTTYWDSAPYWLTAGEPRAHLPHVEIAALDTTDPRLWPELTPKSDGPANHRHAQLLAAEYARHTARGRDVVFDFVHDLGRSKFYWGVADGGKADYADWQEVPSDWTPSERRAV